MSILIATHNDADADWLDAFKQFAAQFGLADETIEYWPQCADKNQVEYLIVWKPQYDICAQLPNVKAIFNLGAGVDHLLLDDSLPVDVPIIRVVDDNLTYLMGEYICLHSLIHLRKMTQMAIAQRQNKWLGLSFLTAEKVTVGVMGLGEIGAYCATKLVELGFKVVGWSNSIKNIDHVKSYYGEDQLDDFLAETEILINILPHTKATDKLIDYQLLQKLKTDGGLGGASFITAGRGKSHVEADIVKALKDGTLISASMDVFEQEPLDSGSDLWALENLIITPHNAAVTDRTTVSCQILQQIANHKQGGALKNIVNIDKGY